MIRFEIWLGDNFISKKLTVQIKRKGFHRPVPSSSAHILLVTVRRVISKGLVVCLSISKSKSATSAVPNSEQNKQQEIWQTKIFQ